MGQLRAEDLKALGLTQSPSNDALKTCVAACARLLNSGGLQTPAGKQSQAILVAAAKGASSVVAKAIAGAGASAGTFNRFVLHKIATLHVGAAGKTFIKREEGFEPMLYDVDGATGRNCTIGYGHLVHPGKCTGTHPAEQPFLNGIDQLQADVFFDKDVKIAESDVKYIFRNGAQVTQPMFDAYVSLLFNLGSVNADETWNVFKNTSKGNYPAAAKEFLNIDKVTVKTQVTDPVTGKVTTVKTLVPVAGLTARRKRESLLFLNGTY